MYIFPHNHMPARSGFLSAAVWVAYAQVEPITLLWSARGIMVGTPWFISTTLYSWIRVLFPSSLKSLEESSQFLWPLAQDSSSEIMPPLIFKIIVPIFRAPSEGALRGWGLVKISNGSVQNRRVNLWSLDEGFRSIQDAGWREKLCGDGVWATVRGMMV